MVLVIVFCIIFLWAVVRNMNFSLDWLWQLVTIWLFYWVGSLFAPLSAVLSCHFTVSTVIAAAFYSVALMMLWMWIKVHIFR
jgi:hypothetical protein